MKTEVFEFKGMKCILRFPTDYEQGKKYPAIMLLHGAGTRGNDIEALKGNPYFPLTEKHESFPFVTVAPQCYTDTWFDIWGELKMLAQYVSELEFVDPARVYLMGASMGGYGTWQLAMSLPDTFAAIVPICGGGMYWNAGKLKNVPVWAFHGALDQTVLPEESEKMVNAVNKRGGSAKLTIYPENGHNAWSDTYSNLEVFEWMLSHTNQKLQGFENEYKGSAIFG